MKFDPFFKCSLDLKALGTHLKLYVPHDVFSTERIDDGTLLLLKHLPTSEPGSVLDMGCGYGALGLPIAVRFPQARVEMVDRDLLAVKWARKNADENKLSNVTVSGSLGYSGLTQERAYDWILCNVPARIGRPFISYLFEAGLTRLSPEGELRVVVITDLAALLIDLAQEKDWPLTEEARGARHVIFALKKSGKHPSPGVEAENLYARDRVEIDGLLFDRPFDLGGDDPKRLAKGLPVLLDALPRTAPKKVLAFRCGYGQLPLISRFRWPEAQVVAVDRDLLGTEFTRRNAKKLGFGGKLLDVRESEHFPDAVGPEERFDLVIGELSPSAGEIVAEAELTALARRILDRNGQALLLVLEKIERQWVGPITKRNKISMTRIIAREGYAVLRLTP